MGAKCATAWFFLFASVCVGSVVKGSAIAVIGNPPVSNLASIFDVSHAGNIYLLGAGTNLIPGFDVRDIFGGQFGTSGGEPGHAIFVDDQPIGTVEIVNVTLPNAVSLKSFTLDLNDDGSSDRSTREFKLFAGNILLDDVTILDSTGTQSFDSVYHGSAVEISDTLLNAPLAATYTLEFIQNESSGGASGLRVAEFEASVPEPGLIGFVSLSAVSLSARRRSRIARPL